MSNEIKRYDIIGDFEDIKTFDGIYVLFTDHEADKAEAIASAVAAKDAEILVLKNAVRIAESRYQSIAEQVRERLVQAVRKEALEDPTDTAGDEAYDLAIEHCEAAIRTADLTDLLGHSE